MIYLPLVWIFNNISEVMKEVQETMSVKNYPNGYAPAIGKALPFI